MTENMELLCLFGAMASGTLFAAAIGFALSDTIARLFKEDAQTVAFLLPFLGAVTAGFLA